MLPGGGEVRGEWKEMHMQYVEDEAQLASHKEASRILKSILPYAGRNKMPEIKVKGNNTSHNNAFL